MATLKRITEGGVYTEDIVLKGTNRNQDIGLAVDVPEGEHVQLGNIFISEVFIPIIKTGKGLLTFKGLYTKGFGGDNFNIRGNGNVVGELINVDHHTPTRPYNLLYREDGESVEECLKRHGEVVYDPSLLHFEMTEEGVEFIRGCHVDAIAQMYATLDDGYTLDDKGTISNVRIPKIVARLADKNTQGIMGSERCNYSDIHLGTEKFDVTSGGHPFHTMFNSLVDSQIGCGDNNVTQGCKIRVLDTKRSGRPIGNNMYNGFPEEDIIGDTSMVPDTPNVRMKTIEVPDFTEIPQDLSIAKFAKEWVLEPAKLEAIAITESNRETHYNGDPSLLFERHIMYRALVEEGFDLSKIDHKYDEIIDRKPYGRKEYGSYANQQRRFEMACEISLPAAIQACSWGFAQLLGKNYKMCGFYSPEDFQNGMQTKAGQMYAFLNYLANRDGLIPALRVSDWHEVKRLYNGPAEHDADGNGIDDYVEKLIKNYTQAVNRKAPNRDKSVVNKSRTIKAVVRDVVAKGSLSVGTVVAGASVDDIVATIKTGSEKIAEVKEDLTTAATDIGETASAVVEVTGSTISYTTVSCFIAGFILATLLFNLKAGKAYLEDQGYTKYKGILDDFIDK